MEVDDNEKAFRRDALLDRHANPERQIKFRGLMITDRYISISDIVFSSTAQLSCRLKRSLIP